MTSSLSLVALATPTFSASVQAKKQYVCPPCGCSHDGEVHDEPGNCPACGMAMVEKTPAMSEITAIPNFQKLNDKVWTGGQPTMEQVAKLKAEGVKVIINLRPHSESNGAREEAKAKELGLSYFNIPVVSREPQAEDADDFLKITDEQLKNGPVFIHCASGARVGAFWMIRRVLRDGWEYDKALEEANKIGLRNNPALTEFAKGYIEKNKKK